MSKIEFAKGLSLPVDAATQTFGFIARKRAGKSYAAGKLVEGLHEQEVQFVVIDAVGNWYGLRLAADGKSKGIDVPVLGGLRGDIPLNADSGKLIADAVADTERSFVLDVSQFSLGERKRFITAFGEQLWLRQKGLKDPRPIHVVLEEAQLILPQAIQSDDARMVGIWTEIVRLGGNKGIGVTLITQRPQSVSKEALTQVECLVVLQVNGVPEKKALKAWIVEKGLETNLLDELPFLKQGTAYIWSPQWLEHFGKHEILPKWTFDAGMTPKVGVKRVQADLKPIDLEGLKAQMAETIQKAGENDPATLKKRIRELEAEAKKPITVGYKVTAPKEVPVLKGSELKRVEVICDRVTVLLEKMGLSQKELQTALGAMASKVVSFQSASKTLQPVKSAQAWAAAQTGHGYRKESDGRVHLRGVAQPEFEPIERERKHIQNFEKMDSKIGKGAREMLKALAIRNPTLLTKTQIAALSGMSPNSGTFSTYMSQLRTNGFIEEFSGAQFGITSVGHDFLGAANIPPAPSSTQELVDLWKSKFPTKVGQMLQELVERHPNWVFKEDLSDIVGIVHTSGTWSTYLSKLRSNGLVETGSAGALKASESLFI